MSRKLKAKGKITRKMTKDGLVERNAVTGEDIRISNRETDFDLRGQLDDAPVATNDAGRGSKSFSQVGKSSQPLAPGNRSKRKQTLRHNKADTPATETKPGIVREPDNSTYLRPSEIGAQAGTTETVSAADISSASGTPLNKAPVADTPETAPQHDGKNAGLRQQSARQTPRSDMEQNPKNAKHRQNAQSQAAEQTSPSIMNEPATAPVIPITQDVPAYEPRSSTTAAEHGDTAMPDVPPKPTAQKPESRLNLNTPGRLQFTKDEAVSNRSAAQKPQGNKPKPEQQPQGDGQQPSLQADPQPSAEPKPESRLNLDKPDRLQFIKDDAVPERSAAGKPQGGKRKPQRPKSEQKTQTSEQTVAQTSDGQGSSIATEIPAKPQSSVSATADAKAKSPAEKPNSRLQTGKPGKLQFTSDEAAPIDAKPKKLLKAERQMERTAGKLEKAQNNLPAKRKLRRTAVVDKNSGEVKKKLQFEKTPISQGEHIKGALPLRPVKAATNFAMVSAHTKLFQVEHENVGVKAAHRAEMVGEAGVRSALRFRKIAPYRKVAKLEQAARKKSINLTYRQALEKNPKLKSNMFSRMWQKRKIKKDYAKAARETKKAAERAKKAGSTVVKAGKAVVNAVIKNPKVVLILLLVGIILAFLLTMCSMVGSIGSGSFGGILTASYLAEDIDIDNAEVAYSEWETDLLMEIANTESSRLGYDEYRYNVGDISHNPYELMAYLTVKYQNFTYAAVEAELRAMFGEQYTLTYTPTVETRYRTVTKIDPDTGESYEEQEAYDWNVLTVTLTARSFTDVAMSRLSGDQVAHYALLLQTKGSRQYVGNPFDFNWLPYVTSYYGYRIHPISGAKDLHRGVDIGLATGTEIKSVQDGTVTFAGVSGGYGNVVIIENDKGFVSKYAHCDTMLVSVGQPVSMGDVIATVGNTGSSTGPHLHLEFLKDGQYLNPLYFVDTGSFSLGPTYGYAGTPMGDGTYAALIAEAEKYLGYPYVWGGSSPATSFDCSGYVSWVLIQSGVKNTGRLGAQGLYNICTPVSPADARPGDLIFFTGTYSAPKPVTHVGIYVGGSPPMMLHCGNPIGYARIDTTYWQNHFYSFGRIN